MSGGPGFSEGVRICDTGVVGVKNPPLTLGLGAAVAGVLAWLFVLIERFNFVGEIIPRLADCWGNDPMRYPGKNPGFPASLCIIFDPATTGDCPIGVIPCEC